MCAVVEAQSVRTWVGDWLGSGPYWTKYRYPDILLVNVCEHVYAKKQCVDSM